MSVYEHWEACKPALRAQLEASDSLSDAAYAVRHALMQVEQNALAAMDDGVLRQQAGVLLGLVKGDCALLTAQASSQVWVPQRHGDKPSRRGLGLWSAPVLVLLALAGYCFLKGLTLGWIAALAALATGAWALLRGMRRPQEAGDEIRVTLMPTPRGCFPFWMPGSRRWTARWRTSPASTASFAAERRKATRPRCRARPI